MIVWHGSFCLGFCGYIFDDGQEKHIESIRLNNRDGEILDFNLQPSD